MVLNLSCKSKTKRHIVYNGTGQKNLTFYRADKCYIQILLTMAYGDQNLNSSLYNFENVIMYNCLQ